MKNKRSRRHLSSNQREGEAYSLPPSKTPLFEGKPCPPPSLSSILRFEIEGIQFTKQFLCTPGAEDMESNLQLVWTTS